MDRIQRLEQRVDDIERRESEQIRLATVVEVDAETALLTCESEDLVQTGIPFFTARAGEDMTYWLPSPGELGYLLSPSGDSANAAFLPGIFFNGFPIPEQNDKIAKRLFRDGTVEEIDTENSHYKLTIQESERLTDTEKVQDKHGTNLIKIDGSETLLERPQGKIKIDNAEILLQRAAGLIKQAVGSNSIEINTFVANIVGALFFGNGITTIQTSMGPGFFSKATTPGAPPPVTPDMAPDANGNATRIPPTTVTGVAMPAGSFTFTLPPIPVVSPTGTPLGVTSATPVVAAITGTGITLVIPGKAL